MNNYSQSFKPLSVEELSLAGLAEGRKNAQGVSTAQAMDTSFDVFDFEREKAQAALDPLEKGRDAIVNNLMNGDSVNTINDLMKLKSIHTDIYKKGNQIDNMTKAKIDYENYVKELAASGAGQDVQRELLNNSMSKYRADGSDGIMHTDAGMKVSNLEEKSFEVINQLRASMDSESGSNQWIRDRYNNLQTETLPSGEIKYMIKGHSYSKQELKDKTISDALNNMYNDDSEIQAEYEQRAKLGMLKGMTREEFLKEKAREYGSDYDIKRTQSSNTIGSWANTAAPTKGNDSQYSLLDENVDYSSIPTDEADEEISASEADENVISGTKEDIQEKATALNNMIKSGKPITIEAIQSLGLLKTASIAFSSNDEMVKAAEAELFRAQRVNNHKAQGLEVAEDKIKKDQVWTDYKNDKLGAYQLSKNGVTDEFTKLAKDYGFSGIKIIDEGSPEYIKKVSSKNIKSNSTLFKLDAGSQNVINGDQNVLYYSKDKNGNLKLLSNSNSIIPSIMAGGLDSKIHKSKQKVNQRKADIGNQWMNDNALINYSESNASPAADSKDYDEYNKKMKNVASVSVSDALRGNADGVDFEYYDENGEKQTMVGQELSTANFKSSDGKIATSIKNGGSISVNVSMKTGTKEKTGNVKINLSTMPPNKQLSLLDNIIKVQGRYASTELIALRDNAKLKASGQKPFSEFKQTRNIMNYNGNLIGYDLKELQSGTSFAVAVKSKEGNGYVNMSNSTRLMSDMIAGSNSKLDPESIMIMFDRLSNGKATDEQAKKAFGNDPNAILLYKAYSTAAQSGEDVKWSDVEKSIDKNYTQPDFVESSARSQASSIMAIRFMASQKY